MVDTHCFLEELKPCPFCGGKGQIWPPAHHQTQTWVTCKYRCEVSLPTQFPTAEAAITAWNTRAPDPDKSALIEVLEMMVENYHNSKVPDEDHDRHNPRHMNRIREVRAVLARVKGETSTSYQARVNDWIQHCFGPEIGADKIERNHRFLEEALELVQSGGCTESEAHQLVDYVYRRPVGEMRQEVGGVMNTLAALCNAYGVDLNAAAEVELDRCWANSEKIRAKQAAKPKHSPLAEGNHGRAHD